MKQEYQDLSELLQYSIPAEAFWAQLPERTQQMAMARREEIRPLRQLRAFAQNCRGEG